MRVLLISPLPGVDPANGDVTYTRNLISEPPSGVEYVTYDKAIASGLLEEFGNRASIKRAISQSKGVVKQACFTSMCKLINWLRRSKLLFNEPFRFFKVRANEFDLIHLHVFSAHFYDLSTPLVVSNAAPTRSLYIDGFRYSPIRTKLLEVFDVVIARILGVNFNSYYLPQATRLLVTTEFLQDWYLKLGVMDKDAIDLVPIYLNCPKSAAVTNPKRVGFVATEFERKGGRILLSAWPIVRKQFPDAELLIVGSDPEMSELEQQQLGVHWFRRMSRDKLIEEYLPTFAVFAYPTFFDGQPLVVLEALAAGVPVITSDYQGVPELVDWGKSGLVVPQGDSKSLADAICHLLAPENNAKYAQCSRTRFAENYCSEVVRQRLKLAYEKAIDESKVRLLP